jgi:hypothetical protein
MSCTPQQISSQQSMTLSEGGWDVKDELQELHAVMLVAVGLMS